MAEIEEIDKEVVREVVDGIWNTFKNLGTQYGGHNEDNLADFDILESELLKYATANFTETYLKPLSEEFYCDWGCPFLPNPSLDIRFEMTKETPNQRVVSTIDLYDLANENANHVYYTFNRVDDNWKLSSIETRSVKEKPFQLTKKEIQRYIDSHLEGWEIFNKIAYEGRNIYIRRNSQSGTFQAMYGDASEVALSVPDEWLEQDGVDSSIAGYWVLQDKADDSNLTIYEENDEGISFKLVINDFEGPKIFEDEAVLNDKSYLVAPYGDGCTFYFTPVNMMK